MFLLLQNHQSRKSQVPARFAGGVKRGRKKIVRKSRYYAGYAFFSVFARFAGQKRSEKDFMTRLFCGVWRFLICWCQKRSEKDCKKIKIPGYRYAFFAVFARFAGQKRSEKDFMTRLFCGVRRFSICWCQKRSEKDCKKIKINVQHRSRNN